MAKTVGVIGAGAAGLVTAQTLLRDGFEVTVLTRDPSPGGEAALAIEDIPTI